MKIRILTEGDKIFFTSGINTVISKHFPFQSKHFSNRAGHRIESEEEGWREGIGQNYLKSFTSLL